MNLNRLPVERITEIFLEQFYVEELREQGFEIESYFDTQDVYALIQGYWSLEGHDGTIHEKKIEVDDTAFLLRGLAYFKKVQNVKIFKPHFLEITRLLEKDHCFPIRQIPERLIEKLFETLQLGNLKVFKVNKDTENREIRNYLHKTVRKSKNLFKAHYIFAEPKWTARADYLLSNEHSVIKIDQRNYELNEIVNSDLFKRLYNKLNKQRPFLRINNFRDALSMCMLNKVAKSQIGVIPFFLATSETIQQLGEDPEFVDDFMFTSGDIKLSLIKSQEFFLFDVIFSSADTVSGELFLKLNELKSKRRLFFEVGDKGDFLKTLQKDILDFVNQEFFDILRELGDGGFDFNESVSKLIYFQETINNEKVKEEFELERRDIVLKMRSNISNLELYEKIWNEVEKLDTAEFNETLLQTTDNIDIFKDTGLTRFSIPEGPIEERLKQVWHAILYDRKIEGQIFEVAKSEIVSKLFDGVKERNYSSLIIGCSIMWVFRSYDLVNDLLLRLGSDYGPHYSLAVIHAACLCQSNHPNKKEIVESILDCITSNPKIFSCSYKAWIGIAFLKFRLWESERISNFRIDKNSFEFNHQDYHYPLEAINLAEKSIHWLEEHRNEVPTKVMSRNVKYLYALNIYVYYISRAATREKFLDENFETVVETFEQAKDTFKQYWQSAYDHTLATYYFRLYYLTPHIMYLTKAKQHFKNFERNSLFGASRFEMLGNLIEKEFNRFKST